MSAATGRATPGRAALFAHPAAHSLSPVMHRAAMQAVGIAGQYDALDVPPDALAGAVANLREAPWWGANVSVPHKRAVMPLLDHISDTAARLGAVNVIVRRGRELEGDNTDLPGFMRALTLLDLELRGARVVVLGAGGAARAVVAGLSQVGAQVLLYNRSAARALELLRDLDLDTQQLRNRGLLERDVQEAQLLVNTTTVGMHGGPEGSPIPDGVLPRAGAVVDLVYRPALTPLLQAARAAGLPFQNGLPMLVYQGAVAFEMWTGVPGPVDAMGWAAAAALDGRTATPGATWFGSHA